MDVHANVGREARRDLVATVRPLGVGVRCRRGQAAEVAHVLCPARDVAAWHSGGDVRMHPRMHHGHGSERA